MKARTLQPKDKSVPGSTSARSQTAPTVRWSAPPLPAASLLQLQRSRGNRFVQQALRAVLIQPKLTRNNEQNVAPRRASPTRPNPSAGITQLSPPLIQRWSLHGNIATSNSEADTLSGLSRLLTGSDHSWPCIQPVKMVSPKAVGADYPYFVLKGDKFDVSNLRLSAGPTLNLRMLGDADDPPLGLAFGKVYGGTVTLGPEEDIEAAATSGKTPIQELVLAGHTYGGTAIWGHGNSWDVAKVNPNDPSPTKELATVGMLPRRCWFTPNAKVRIVGCDSAFVARGFANAFLRRGASATGTNHDVCGWTSTAPTASVFMTFDFLPCHWPPTPPRRHTAASMNSAPRRWVTTVGRL